MKLQSVILRRQQSLWNSLMKYICDHVSIMFIHVLVQIYVQLPNNFVYIQLYVNNDLTLPTL